MGLLRRIIMLLLYSRDPVGGVKRFTSAITFFLSIVLTTVSRTAPRSRSSPAIYNTRWSMPQEWLILFFSSSLTFFIKKAALKIKLTYLHAPDCRFSHTCFVFDLKVYLFYMCTGLTTRYNDAIYDNTRSFVSRSSLIKKKTKKNVEHRRRLKKKTLF